MVLADAEDIQADLIGQLDGLKQIAQALDRADSLLRPCIGRNLDKGIHADLEGRRESLNRNSRLLKRWMTQLKPLF